MGKGESNRLGPVLVEDFTVEIDPAEVKRFLGSKKGERVNTDGRFEDVIGEAIDDAGSLVRPRGIYIITSGRDLPDSVVFADLDRVAFCICTIGPELEGRVTDLAGEGELLRAVALDAAGSVAAEAVAEHMDGEIRAAVSGEGFKTSCRASPGYGDWDIREQASIFRLVPGERIGVALTESFMMIPRKSVTFAVHVSDRPVRMRSENSCRNCDIEDCPYRLLE